MQKCNRFQIGYTKLGRNKLHAPTARFFNWSRYKFNLSCNEWNELIVCVCVCVCLSVCVQRMQSRPCPAHTERDSFLVSENELWFLYVICLFMRPQTQVKLNGHLLNKVRRESEGRGEKSAKRRRSLTFGEQLEWGHTNTERKSEKRPQNQNHKSRETKFAKRNDRNKTTCGKQDKTLTAASGSKVGVAATARLANGLWQKQQKCWNERVEIEMQIKRSKIRKQMSRTYSGRYKMLLYKTERERRDEGGGGEGGGGATEQLWLSKLAGSAAYKLTHTHTQADRCV